MIVSAAAIEPIRKHLGDFLGTKLTFDEVHNELMLLEFGMPPKNAILSQHIVQFIKNHFTEK